MLQGISHPTRSLEFVITCWLLWKNRNEVVFQNASVSCDQLRLRVLNWIAGVRETMKAGDKVFSTAASVRNEVLVGWNAAPSDFVTVNTDGSVIQPNSDAAAGGIFRDSQGKVLHTFAANLGRCTITRAELRGAIFGLRLAWDHGFRKVILQLDSRCAISGLLGDPPDDFRHLSCILAAKQLLDRDWDVRITHTFREGNRVADALAHYGHSLPFGCRCDFPLSSTVLECIRADLIGVSFPRLIVSND
ncbi:Putative ribonuclease H protein At1g65750 [Linum grandiflorum]